MEEETPTPARGAGAGVGMEGREEGRTSCEAEQRRAVEDGTGRECRMEEERVTTVGSGWYVARA
jgi:hypothetical protein